MVVAVYDTGSTAFMMVCTMLVLLLWFGWFGFNAGSQFAADGTAALALLNTAVASAAGILVTLAVVIVGGLAIGFAVKAIYDGSLRVSETDEARGLDVAAHGESAYPAYLGLD